MKLLAIAAALTFGIGIINDAGATIIVDQTFHEAGGFDMSTPSRDYSSFRRAQTFTVGINGILNSIAVFGSSQFDSINILSTLNGVPTTILGMSSQYQATGRSTTFDVSALNVNVAVGDVFAFEVKGWGMLDGAYGYSGGSDFYINPSFGINSFTSNSSSDSFFVTTVDGQSVAVPEPGSIGLFLIAGISMLALRRRFVSMK
jgi:hypothetical protein